MEDVNSNPEHRDLIRAAGRREPVDWDVVYVGYKSAVDWPTAYFWRELAEYFPDAKLILTVRNPEDWYRSARATIFNAMGETDPQSFGRAVIETKIFGGRACCSIQWPKAGRTCAPFSACRSGPNPSPTAAPRPNSEAASPNKPRTEFEAAARVTRVAACPRPLRCL
nr:sulfotransferase [Mesorhizobium sp.]